jgi:hypothetical protein
MIDPSIADLRVTYARAALDERDVDVDAMTQFRRWFDEAVAARVPEPNAMTLATATADGAPDARVVLLKGADARGFSFYTDYRSAKGAELDANPRAALVFWWGELERQVRVTGRVERVARDEGRGVLRLAPARLAARRLDLLAVERAPAPRGARRGAGRGGGALRRRRRPAAGALGRLPRGAGHPRALAGAPEPAARPHPVRA